MRRTDWQHRRTVAGTVGFALLWAGEFFACTMSGPAAAAQPATVPAAVLVFAGSGTNLPVVRVLAEAFGKDHPEIKIEVPASIGSSGGIQAAADGAIALGLVSRPLREKEKGLGLTIRNYARSPVIIAVHPSVGEEDISFAEILDIYRGKKNRWRDGSEIVVLTREPGDSSIEVLVKEVPGFRQVYADSQQARRWTTLHKDRTMNETLARIPAAFGLSDLGAVLIEKHAIKPLKVNGVAPTAGSHLPNDKYPLFKTLAFVYREDRLPAGARLFIDFVRSKEGEKLLKANGYLPEH